MTPLTRHWPPLLTIALSLLAGLVATPWLPARIPVHWGIDGAVTSYSDKDIGVYLNPGAMIVAYLFFTLIPYSDKRRVHELRELRIYEPLRNTAVYAFALAQIFALGIGLGVVNASANYLIGLGCLLVLLGAEAARSDLLIPLLEAIPRRPQVSGATRNRVAARLEIAAGLGMAGTLWSPRPFLWFAVPAALFIGSEWLRHRA